MYKYHLLYIAGVKVQEEKYTHANENKLNVLITNQSKLY